MGRVQLDTYPSILLLKCLFYYKIGNRRMARIEKRRKRKYVVPTTFEETVNTLIRMKTEDLEGYLAEQKRAHRMFSRLERRLRLRIYRIPERSVPGYEKPVSMWDKLKKKFRSERTEQLSEGDQETYRKLLIERLLYFYKISDSRLTRIEERLKHEDVITVAHEVIVKSLNGRTTERLEADLAKEKHRQKEFSRRELRLGLQVYKIRKSEEPGYKESPTMWENAKTACMEVHKKLYCAVNTLKTKMLERKTAKI
ncbi:hypothetical protein GCK72_008363 [Caenorhabditis remanei]|uniref:Uncharacterized protein n=1 Tax=Caenorhabditis remanei TaxID=31234 RepID=A0A6A5GYF5_CAERE|nr:hypothetical protein GCK72_008363 [Caenorhabditis remanei]KAF1760117.1 hypothetical protein GCK72_008363 [Caenorhabditis remanei]